MEKHALEANMPRLKAKEDIESAFREGRELTPESLFDLTMMATGGIPTDLAKGEWVGGNRDLAEKRHNDAILKRQTSDEGNQNQHG